MKVFKIPEMGRTARGRAIVNLLELRAGEQVVAFQPIEDFERSEDYLLFGTALGRIKRTSLKDYRNVHRSGIIAINLNEGDRLIDVVLTRGGDDVLLATRNGMAIRFHENDARVMGRSAAGVRGIDLKSGDEVVGLVRADDGADLLTVTVNGFGKRTALSDYLVHMEDGSTRPQSRGGKGRIDIRTTTRNGPVVAIVAVQESDGIVFVSAQGMIVRVPVKTISRIGRATQGVTLVKLKEGDRLIAAARVVASDEAGEAGEASEEIPEA
jgi:DNA gyrase subunit A